MLGWTGHVLIDEDGVSIRVNQHEACRARSVFIGLAREREDTALERPLNAAHIFRVGQGGRFPSQPGLQVSMFFSNILWKSPIVLVTLRDQPVLHLIAARLA